MTKQEAHTIFIRHADGTYTRTDYPPQCGNTVFIMKEFGICQDAKGHYGDCWCYSPFGDLLLHHNPNGGCSGIPPDHKDYIHPKDMQSRYYRNKGIKTTVTDPVEIARLDARQIKEDELLTGCLFGPNDVTSEDK